MNRDKSRTTATSKVEHFLIIVNGYAAVLDEINISFITFFFEIIVYL